MVFYKVIGTSEWNQEVTDRRSLKKSAIATALSKKSGGMIQKLKGKGCVAVDFFKNNSISFVVAGQTNETAQKQLETFIKQLPFAVTIQAKKEIPFFTFAEALEDAAMNGFVGNNEEYIRIMELDKLQDFHATCSFKEGIINSELSRKEMETIAKEAIFTDTLLPELHRIYTKTNLKPHRGHPVHYVIQSENRMVEKQVLSTLLSALYQNNRIQQKRFTLVEFSDDVRHYGPTLEMIYKTSVGGTVVLQGIGSCNAADLKKRMKKLIAVFCSTALRYKNKVLTVFSLPPSLEEFQEQAMEYFETTAFVELKENVVSGQEAVALLKEKAKENKVRCNKLLVEQIKEGKEYTAKEIHRIFDEWFSHKLRQELYPQYQDTKSRKEKRQNQTTESAYVRLQNLVGLSKAKEVITQALNYFKVQKLFAEKGIHNQPPTMHMVFTGNPGTAKTTVARLFGQIMKENDLLENGQFWEVGRADLVGKFAGHTAALVKEVFAKARGGVLFIDEAYSLVDYHENSFGDEAINTIVQEMENHREDTIVILAGYPSKMEDFFERNPGLRSRVAFHVSFDDYSPEELCQIAQSMAKEKGYEMENSAGEKLANLFEAAVSHSDFGNGRYARNVIEKAKMAQANRLMQMEFDTITHQDVVTLRAEDIELPMEEEPVQGVHIGFCA